MGPQTKALSRSHDAEHLHRDGRREVAEQHRGHQDAERAADQHAEDAVKLSEEFGTHQLRLNKINNQLACLIKYGRLQSTVFIYFWAQRYVQK